MVAGSNPVALVCATVRQQRPTVAFFLGNRGFRPFGLPPAPPGWFAGGRRFPPRFAPQLLANLLMVRPVVGPRGRCPLRRVDRQVGRPRQGGLPVVPFEAAGYPLDGRRRVAPAVAFQGRANCGVRVLPSAAAYAPVETPRWVELAGTELVHALATTIRLKLLKIAGRVVRSVRRVVVHLAGGLSPRRLSDGVLTRLREYRCPPASAGQPSDNPSHPPAGKGAGSRRSRQSHPPTHPARSAHHRRPLPVPSMKNAGQASTRRGAAGLGESRAFRAHPAQVAPATGLPVQKRSPTSKRR